MSAIEFLRIYQFLLVFFQYNLDKALVSKEAANAIHISLKRSQHVLSVDMTEVLSVLQQSIQIKEHAAFVQGLNA